MKNQVQKSTGILKVLSTKIAANAVRAILFLSFFLLIGMGESALAQCVSSSAITPSGAQSNCKNAYFAPLTNTITTTGSGNPAQTYVVRWWYNTTNSNDNTTATLVQTSGTLTAGTDGPTTYTINNADPISTGYYFCSDSLLDNGNGCGNSAGTVLLSNTVSITVYGGVNIAGDLSGIHYFETDCSGDAIQVSQNITITPNSSTPTVYDWYSNTTNNAFGGTLVLGGHHITTATTDTYSPPSPTSGPDAIIQ